MKTEFYMGIDPGTGSSSPAAIALYNAYSNEVLSIRAFWPDDRKAEPIKRIKTIATQVDNIIKNLVRRENSILTDCTVACEDFVMRGKGGATLQMFRGAILTLFPLDTRIVTVQNTGMKRLVTGTGKADKKQIGEALLNNIPKNAELIKMLIEAEGWDELDAIGIAYAACKMDS